MRRLSSSPKRFYQPFVNASIGSMNKRSFDSLKRFEEKMWVATNRIIDQLPALLACFLRLQSTLKASQRDKFTKNVHRELRTSCSAIWLSPCYRTKWKFRLRTWSLWRCYTLLCSHRCGTYQGWLYKKSQVETWIVWGDREKPSFKWWRSRKACDFFESSRKFKSWK